MSCKDEKSFPIIKARKSNFRSHFIAVEAAVAARLSPERKKKFGDEKSQKVLTFQLTLI